MAMAIPMIMGLRGQGNGTNKLIKYLLMFGGFGIAVMLFIFFAKKFNPIKSIENFFKNAGKGLTGIIGKFGKNITKGAAELGENIKKSIDDTRENVEKFAASKRREFRRLAKQTARNIERMKKGLTKHQKELSKRLNVVGSAFRKTWRRKTRDIGKIWANTFKRKKKKVKRKRKKRGWLPW